MRTLFLQHFDSLDLRPLVLASARNISAYAHWCGADYTLLAGDIFDPAFSFQGHKLAVLDPMWDHYEQVIFIDTDMFAVRGPENLFNVPGCGFHQEQAHQRVCSLFPKLTNPTAPFYGGCLYKFTREERRALRAEIDLDELKQFDNAAGGWDEGMMHRLCLRAKLPARYLSEAWCWSSYKADMSQAKMIHIRTKPTGDKWKNLQQLQKNGVIAP